MRDFFAAELETLYLKTGFRQHYTLSAMPEGQKQISLLLDELVKMSNNFPFIPEDKKKQIVLAYMMTDADFQGFNPKILWKWFNIENRKYLPKDQNQVDDECVTPIKRTKEDIEKINQIFEQWKKNIASAPGPTPRADGIRDVRIQQMKAELETIQCKHPDCMEFSETHVMCIDCGFRATKEEYKAMHPEGKIIVVGPSVGGSGV